MSLFSWGSQGSGRDGNTHTQVTFNPSRVVHATSRSPNNAEETIPSGKELFPVGGQRCSELQGEVKDEGRGVRKGGRSEGKLVGS